MAYYFLVEGLTLDHIEISTEQKQRQTLATVFHFLFGSPMYRRLKIEIFAIFCSFIKFFGSSMPFSIYFPDYIITSIRFEWKEEICSVENSINEFCKLFASHFCTREFILRRTETCFQPLQFEFPECIL